VTVEETAIPADSSYYVERIAQWGKAGPSPYLQDGDSDLVSASSGLSGTKTIGDWHFPNSGGSGTINSVKLSVRHKDAGNPPDSELDIGISVDGGSTWTEYYVPIVGASYVWSDIDISALIGQDWSKLNNLRFYLKTYGFFTGSGTFYVSAVHRKTDYTAGGGPSVQQSLGDGSSWVTYLTKFKLPAVFGSKLGVSRHVG